MKNGKKIIVTLATAIFLSTSIGQAQGIACRAPCLGIYARGYHAGPGHDGLGILHASQDPSLHTPPDPALTHLSRRRRQPRRLAPNPQGTRALLLVP